MQEFKKWEDLTITDDFMFCKVMSDPDICKEIYIIGCTSSRFVPCKANFFVNLWKNISKITVIL